MIHPPDVIPKYAPDAIIGEVGAGAPKKVKKAKVAKGGAAKSGAPARVDKGSTIANHQAWGHMDVHRIGALRVQMTIQECSSSM